MKRHDQERLINLAFGELSDADAAQVEGACHLDPASARELARLKQIRADLMLLNNIPEPQLSTERMREAILRRGLKERRFNLGWGWSLLPVLTASVALVFVYSRPSLADRQTVRPASTPSSVAALPPGTMPDDLFAADTELTDPAHAIRLTYTYGHDSSGHDTPPRIALKLAHRARRAEPLVDPANHDLFAMTIPTETANTENTVPASGSTQAAGQDDASNSSEDSPRMIVVHDSQDNVSGAQQATEVEATSNDLVGG